MNSIVNLEELNHRSKDRIKSLGEVFTPEFYVEEMLNLLAKENKTLWSDENIAFFEPCSGHGNIVLSIYKRRLEGFYKKAANKKIKEAAFYAVANSINTLWAIDIDNENVENCRTRVFAASVVFLVSKQNKDINFLISQKKDFFAHLLAAINWHISENETLSALSDSQSAKRNAGLTKIGAEWFSKNQHKPLDFQYSYVDFLKKCIDNNISNLKHKRAAQFIESYLKGKQQGFSEFYFAKIILSKPTDNLFKDKIHKTKMVG